jgi:hypothetical protein
MRNPSEKTSGISTRERNTALVLPNSLYSPFWRLQGEAAEFGTQTRGPGTYLYSKGYKQEELSAWTLVDFALADGSLVQAIHRWKLIEPECRILYFDGLDFGDHLPIYVEVTYNDSEEDR